MSGPQGSKSTQEGTHQSPPTPMMNYILWNVRGGNNAEFKWHCLEMVKMHKPAMLVLLETKMADHQTLAQQLQFDMIIQSPTIGPFGGIVLMWKEEFVAVEEVATTPQGIHAMVKVSPDHPPWLFSAIYANNLLANRKLLWEDLITISKNIKTNWFIGGDFNEVLKARNKFGGNPINLSRSNLFWNCINECNLLDLGYKGSKYTWTNKRYSNKTSLILERIDRCFANEGWIEQYPEASVLHFPRTHSDHCPLQINMVGPPNNKPSRPFRFESMWASHPSFPNIINRAFSNHSTLLQSTESFKILVTKWKQEVFGNIFHQKKRLLARISGIQKSPSYQFCSYLLHLETKLNAELNLILKNEEDFWKLKSRINWLNEGNASTRFFTHPPSIEEGGIESSLLKMRMEIGFMTKRTSIQQLWASLLSSKQHPTLKPLGIPQTTPPWNPFCLKAKRLLWTNLFMPIGLCNTIYKSVTKIIVNRIKPILPHIIGPSQASFLSNRRACDNAIIVQEYITHFRKMRGKSGNKILKIDLEKAFDRLEWSFIRDTLAAFNFPHGLSKLIMSYISTSSISILVNVGKTESFKSSRGIRQGDPTSPYLFIMCMERLSRSIDNTVLHNQWHPISISRSGPKISHLFFADDLTLFAKANDRNGNTILSILQNFNEQSGQKINLTKSRVLFSSNITQDVIQHLTNSLSIKHTTSFGKYLGFPIIHKKQSATDFQFIIDNMQSKMAGWKTKCLNMAGRTVLAKTSLNSIPSHVMKYINLPTKITNQIDRIQRNFLWGTTTERKKLHLIKWEVVTKNKAEGGLGLQRLVSRTKLHSQIWHGEPIRIPTDYGLEFSFKNIATCLDQLDHSDTLNTQNLQPGRTAIRQMIEGPLTQNDLEAKVSSIHNMGNWDTSALSINISPSILNLLNSVFIPLVTTKEDNLIWDLTPNGQFSNSSAYSFLSRTTTNLLSGEEGSFKWIWNLQTPNKIKYFIWLLTHKRLPTRSFLHSIGINCVPQCHYCDNEQEDIAHIFFECPNAVHFWNDILSKSTGNSSNNHHVFNSLQCLKNVPFNNHIYWDNLIPFCLWHIWLTRNNNVFNNKKEHINANNTISKATEYLKLTKNDSTKVTHQIMLKWEPPSRGSYKLNTDGAARRNPGIGGSEGVFRNHNGDWILGYMYNIPQTTNTRAEVQALIRGLQLAEQNHLVNHPKDGQRSSEAYLTGVEESR
ncbi:PREDICTED: uncharacterized protein LOC109243087 [Nicotiana attenuata]|uniref:uncharacterized protein LOC109243087 n=1 Tax=Nicotiana attenuata TaxID=49451 RepID=UPI0009051432|nr:PREDICTED: uncharacterized protein LOC109243087 [Nicotiana attenuata]